MKITLSTQEEEFVLSDEQADVVRHAIGMLIQPRCPCHRCEALHTVLERWDEMRHG